MAFKMIASSLVLLVLIGCGSKQPAAQPQPAVRPEPPASNPVAPKATSKYAFAKVDWKVALPEILEVVKRHHPQAEIRLDGESKRIADATITQDVQFKKGKVHDVLQTAPLPIVFVVAEEYALMMPMAPTPEVYKDVEKLKEYNARYAFINSLPIKKEIDRLLGFEARWVDSTATWQFKPD